MPSSQYYSGNIQNHWLPIFTESISNSFFAFHSVFFLIPLLSASSNSIVREMIDDADEDTRRELEILMDGGTIEKPVHEDITYGDIHESMDNLWNFLFFTGYLKAGKQRSDGENIYLELSIPNTEVKTIYRQSIVTWFDKKIKATDRSPLIRALEEGDCETA